MKFVTQIDPEVINAATGELIETEKTNGVLIHSQVDEMEGSGKKVVSIGAWGGTPGIINCCYTENELCVISSGIVKLTNQEGEQMIFSAGHGFIIKSGFEGTWESIGNVKKWYVVYE